MGTWTATQTYNPGLAYIYEKGCRVLVGLVGLTAAYAFEVEDCGTGETAAAAA
jgi:hypothetical protein